MQFSKHGRLVDITRRFYSTLFTHHRGLINVHHVMNNDNELNNEIADRAMSETDSSVQMAI